MSRSRHAAGGRFCPEKIKIGIVNNPQHLTLGAAVIAVGPLRKRKRRQRHRPIRRLRLQVGNPLIIIVNGRLHRIEVAVHFFCQRGRIGHKGGQPAYPGGRQRRGQGE